jgi:hypothetical protein
MKPLITRTDLDAELAKLECECCDESVDVLVFEPRCHRDAGLAADYGDGELTLRCCENSALHPDRERMRVRDPMIADPDMDPLPLVGRVQAAVLDLAPDPALEITVVLVRRWMGTDLEGHVAVRGMPTRKLESDPAAGVARAMPPRMIRARIVTIAAA